MLLLSITLYGCGGSSSAVRVGSATISQATVDHWSTISSREQSGPRAKSEQQALEFLIVSHWLIGEASERRLLPTRAEVSQRVEATRSVILGGSESKFTRNLKAAGRTAADLQFEVETELAYSHLREAVVSAAATVRPSEVQAYYDAHPQSFFLSERRDFDIDNLRSDAAALKVRAEVEAGRPLHPVLHEHIERATAYKMRGKVKIERAILAAKIGELNGPFPIEPFKLHSIFIVRKILPRRREPLAAVKSEIESLLRKHKQQQALASFNAGWQGRWTAKTDCNARLKVRGCSSFHGAKAPTRSFAIEATGLWAAERSNLSS